MPLLPQTLSLALAFHGFGLKSRKVWRTWPAPQKFEHLHSIRRRAVLPERPLYPAFATDNFPEVHSAANLALQHARVAASRKPNSATVKRDLAFAEAAVLRWPPGSKYGPSRDAAEKAYSAALGKYGGARCMTGFFWTSPFRL